MGIALMGTREDVAFAVTSKGWDYMMQCISNLISNGGDHEAQEVMDLINESDAHWVNPDDDHMIYWNQIKSSADDFVDFQNLLAELDDKSMENEYYMLILNEDGTDESVGGWFDNHFQIGVHRNINYEVGSCVLQCPPPKTKPPVDTSKRYWNITVPATPINDHTCTQCGNNACSKTEKSCWKCGHPIT
jgi:hypothetical protein